MDYPKRLEITLNKMYFHIINNLVLKQIAPILLSLSAVIILLLLSSCNKNQEQKTRDSKTKLSEIEIADSLKTLNRFSEANRFLFAAKEKMNSTIQPMSVISINNRIAYNYRRLGVYDSAFHFCYNSINIEKLSRNKDDLNIAQTYYLLGLLYRESDQDSSYKYLIKALNIRKSILGNQNPLVGDVFNNLGVVFLFKNNYNKAIEYYKKALALRKHRGIEHPSVGSTYMNIANLFQEMGEYKKSLAYYDTSLTIQKSKNIENNPRVAALLSNMANTYDDLGMIDKSIELDNKALEIYKNVYGNEHPYIATVYNNLAVQSISWGDYSGASEYLLESIRIKSGNEKEFRNELLDNYINLGETYINIQKYDLAIDVLNKGLKICFELNNNIPYTTSLILFFLSDLHLAKHQPMTAVTYAEQGLEMILRNYHSNSFEVARANYKVSYVYLETNRLSKATKYANKALSFFDKKPGEYLRWIVFSEMVKCNIHYKKRNYQKSIREIINLSDNFTTSKKNLDFNKIQEYGLSNLFINLKYLLAHNYYELYKISHDKSLLRNAVNAISESEKIFEKIRYTAKNEKSKIILSQKMENIFNLGIEVLFLLNKYEANTYYFETALNFAEKNKSLLLLESISEKQIAKFAEIPDSLLIKRERLQSLINKKERKLEKADVNNETVETIRAELFSLKLNLEKFNKNLETNYKNYTSLMYNKKNFSLNSIRDKILGNNQTLIEYFLTNKLLYTFIISDSSFKFIRTKLTTNITGVVNNFTESIMLNNKSKFNKYSYQLYQILIEPCEQYIKTERLLIINDGILGYIPYDALISSKVTTEISYKNYPYLIKRYSFGYAFSIGILNESESVNTFINSFVGIAPLASH